MRSIRSKASAGRSENSAAMEVPAQLMRMSTGPKASTALLRQVATTSSEEPTSQERACRRA
eukprot:10903667-Prorocentrum_lima.AAC.1